MAKIVASFSLSLLLGAGLYSNIKKLASQHVLWRRGGVVATWLARSTQDPAVLVRALAGDIVLCSWAIYLTPTVPLSTQVYKIGNRAMVGNRAMEKHPIQGAVEIL